jgi:hypothetical protein
MERLLDEALRREAHPGITSAMDRVDGGPVWLPDPMSTR